MLENIVQIKFMILRHADSCRRYTTIYNTCKMREKEKQQECLLSKSVKNMDLVVESGVYKM